MPETYVDNVAERMELYRNLDTIKEMSKIDEFRKNLEDRFGELPTESEGLLRMIKIRLEAEKLGVEKLIYKNRSVRIQFVSNQESPFYKSQIFSHILQWLQQNSKMAKMEEKQGKLWMIIKKADSLNAILTLLEEMSFATIDS